MRFFKRIQRALDAFLAPDDNPVRSSHAIDAGRGTSSPHVDAHDELREPSDSPPPPSPPDEFDYDDSPPPPWDVAPDGSDDAGDDDDGLDGDCVTFDADDDDADYLPDDDFISGGSWNTPPPRVKRRRAVVKRVDNSSRGRSPTLATPGSGTSRAFPRSPEPHSEVRVQTRKTPNKGRLGEFHHGAIPPPGTSAAHALHTRTCICQTRRTA